MMRMEGPVESRAEYLIRETRNAIDRAPDHYLKAEAALRCDVKNPDGKPHFADEYMAHSMLALVEELRKK